MFSSDKYEVNLFTFCYSYSSWEFGMPFKKHQPLHHALSTILHWAMSLENIKLNNFHNILPLAWLQLNMNTVTLVNYQRPIETYQQECVSNFPLVSFPNLFSKRHHKNNIVSFYLQVLLEIPRSQFSWQITVILLVYLRVKN